MEAASLRTDSRVPRGYTFKQADRDYSTPCANGRLRLYSENLDGTPARDATERNILYRNAYSEVFRSRRKLCRATTFFTFPRITIHFSRKSRHAPLTLLLYKWTFALFRLRPMHRQADAEKSAHMFGAKSQYHGRFAGA